MGHPQYSGGIAGYTSPERVGHPPAAAGISEAAPYVAKYTPTGLLATGDAILLKAVVVDEVAAGLKGQCQW